MIVEDTEKFLDLVKGKSILLEPIKGSDTYHPKLTTTIGINVFNGDLRFVVPIDHPEGKNISFEEINSILRQAGTVFTNDKKNLLYSFLLNKSIDLKSNNCIPVESKTYGIFNWTYNRYGDNKEVNKLIPLVKHLEKFSESISPNQEKFLQNYKPTFETDFFNEQIVPTFFLVEQQGLGVYYEPFVEIFKPTYPSFNIKDNITYTNYNLYNPTGRPTNAFNSINFAAIPKKEEYRKCFRPQNDFFVEFDFDGYHLRLLSDQLNFTLTEESAHTQLGKQYFKKETLTEEEYLRTKQINFQAIYGNIPRELVDFPLFKKIEEYSNKLWMEYQEEGNVADPISGKTFYKDRLEDMNPKKLLNYMIQSLETSRNVLILKNALNFLKDKKSNIALYTYDSILIDFSKEDEKETLLEVEKILSENKKYPVRFKYSKNLVL